MKSYGDAIIVLMKEAQSENTSVSAYKRCKRACTFLSLTVESENRIMQLLDYHNSEGKPYLWLAAKL